MFIQGSGIEKIELSDNQYTKLSRMIYDTGGIHLGDNKKELVHARLTKILRKRNIRCFNQYLQILKGDETGGELIALLDAISTNVTHFFRENQHFDFLARCLSSRSSKENLRIWSAGCSSGEEPYTIAITLLEQFSGAVSPGSFILATDLSTKVLQRAVHGIYPMKVTEKVDKSLVKKYFLKGKGKNPDLVKIKKEVAKLVKFERLNLIKSFRFSKDFDFIFCRNVMIYFDRETRRSLSSKFYDALKPGGYLIIGHSESMNAFKHDFKYIQPTIYRKI